MLMFTPATKSLRGIVNGSPESPIGFAYAGGVLGECNEARMVILESVCVLFGYRSGYVRGLLDA